jgi:hypothetical protein
VLQRIGPILGLAAILLTVGGCERRIPKDQLGKVVFEIPKVPGWDTPPDLSELNAAPAQKVPAGEHSDQVPPPHEKP